ncbi:MAG: cytochrome C [Gammaproteobacteria bacterium]|jgi:sulfide dehydrogenase cytochrome subunit
MKLTRVLFPTFFIAGLLCAGTADAEDLTVNRLLASQCAQCHGTDGKSAGGIEGLEDESYKDLYEDLMDMRSEDRPETIMDHQALGYTEDQIDRIAYYFGLLAGKADEAPEFED